MDDRVTSFEEFNKRRLKEEEEKKEGNLVPFKKFEARRREAALKKGTNIQVNDILRRRLGPITDIERANPRKRIYMILLTIAVLAIIMICFSYL